MKELIIGRNDGSIEVYAYEVNIFITVIDNNFINKNLIINHLEIINFIPYISNKILSE